MPVALRDSDFLKAWLAFILAATIFGAIAGLVAGMVSGFILGFFGAPHDTIGLTGTIAGAVAAIAASYSVFRLSVQHFVVRKLATSDGETGGLPPADPLENV